MNDADFSQLKWFKSSRSSPTGQCVESARLSDGMAVRDSKHPDGPVLLFSADKWRAFTEGVNLSEFE